MDLVTKPVIINMEININDINPPQIYLNGYEPKKVDIPKPKLELRSEEVSDVLSKRPMLIIRHGLTIIALMGIVGILASWYIKYPEIIKGNAIITTEVPPIKVMPKASGRLQKLLVHPNQAVHQGDFVAEIENTTRLENLPVLQTLSQQLKRYLQNTSLKVVFPSNALTFGDLQMEYNNLLKNYQESERLLDDVIYGQRKNILIQQIADYKKLVAINQQQVEINKEEFRNIEMKYLADKKLYQEKVYGKLEFLGFENTFLQKKKENENYAKILIENSLTLSERQKQLVELDFEYLQKTRTYQDNLQQSVQNIENLLANWQQNYIISAPSDGTLNFLKNLTENQMIRAGDTLFAVVPQKQTIIALANVTAQNFGKVKVGQKAIVKLVNYPFEEYGSLSGSIQNIEYTPMGNQYRIQIKLPTGLNTNYHKTLPFRADMQGSVEIITEDLRLLERFFYNIRKILNQY